MAFKKLFDFSGSMGERGSIGKPGLTFEQFIIEKNRKRLLVERKNKIEKINEKSNN